MKKFFLSILLFTSFLQAQTFSDISDLIDENLANGSKITAAKHREVEHALLDYIQANVSQSGDIKVIKCDLAYLNDNFEANGLGKNLRLGWAICNGNNGTDNLSGRVIVQMGVGYSLGATGGSKDAVLVEHTHALASRSWTGNTTHGLTDSDVIAGRNLDRTGYTTNGTGGQPFVQSAGVSGTDKNMQPYSVQLYIMKL